MKRMKTFMKYLIAFIALYFISNFLIGYILVSNYDAIPSESGKVESSNYDITISEAKATNANGIINGSISKKEGSQEQDQYLKVDFFSKLGNLIGTEYYDISSLRRWN